jgi:hypothetical protein
MSEAKTRCVDCGRAILQRTADRRDGRCVPCYEKAAAIPPQGFQVPQDLAARLVTLNEDPAHFRPMAWQHGTEFVHRFIDKLVERNKLRQEWFPRLRAFADKCREDHPPPVDETLSNSERAKQRIYAGKLKLNRAIPGRDKTVAICSMPLLAIPVALRLWPRDDGRIVLLTPEEEDQWDRLYSHPEGSFRWFVHFWWRIDDSPERERSLPDGGSFARWDEKDVQGENPWLVTVGHVYGPLAGAGYQELWSWNGSRARLIAKLEEWIS